jgi:hypothetical protein
MASNRRAARWNSCYLAALVAGILGWIALMIYRDNLDLNDPSSAGFHPQGRFNQGRSAGQF